MYWEELLYFSSVELLSSAVSVWPVQILYLRSSAGSYDQLVSWYLIFFSQVQPYHGSKRFYKYVYEYFKKGVFINY